jgi:lipoyl(octanoyl) transferase
VRWSLIRDAEGRPGWWHMALDLALVEEAAQTGEAFLRLYRWSPPALSFGRNEPALRRYDRAHIARIGIDTVRRPTGGRAVWHAAELTYALAAPEATLGGAGLAYRLIHETLARALGTLGVPCVLAPATRPLGVGAGACFAAAVGGEVVVAGRKLVGSAQLRLGGALLQHGSVLLAGDQRLVAEVTTGSPPPHAETSASEVAGRAITFEATAAAVTAELFRGPWAWQAYGGDLDRLAARHAERFRDPAWTWRR